MMHKVAIQEMDTAVARVFAKAFSTLMRGLAMDIFGNTDVIVFNHASKPSLFSNKLICTYNAAPLYTHISAKDLPEAEKALKDRSNFAFKLAALLTENNISHILELANGTGKGICAHPMPKVIFRINSDNVATIDTIGHKLAIKTGLIPDTDTETPAFGRKYMRAEDFPLIFIKGGLTEACTPG